MAWLIIIIYIIQFIWVVVLVIRDMYRFSEGTHRRDLFYKKGWKVFRDLIPFFWLSLFFYAIPVAMYRHFKSIKEEKEV